MEFDEIAFADADEFAGDAATEGPESVIDAVGEAPAQFAYFQVNDDFGGVIAMDRRRYAGAKVGCAFSSPMILSRMFSSLVAARGAAAETATSAAANKLVDFHMPIPFDDDAINCAAAPAP